MLFYDINSTQVFTEVQLSKKGFNTKDILSLCKKGIYRLLIEQLDYDKNMFGVKKDGYPKPSEDDATIFIQHMQLYNLFDEAKTSMLRRLKDIRKQKETGLVTLPNGLVVDASRDSRNMITQTILGLSKAENIDKIPFQAENGWYELTREDLDVLSQFLVYHVESCFTKQKQLEEQIEQCTTLEELQQIDITSGWPNDKIQESISSEFTEPELKTEENSNDDNSIVENVEKSEIEVDIKNLD